MVNKRGAAVIGELATAQAKTAQPSTA